VLSIDDFREACEEDEYEKGEFWDFVEKQLADGKKAIKSNPEFKTHESQSKKFAEYVYSKPYDVPSLTTHFIPTIDYSPVLLQSITGYTQLAFSVVVLASALPGRKQLRRQWEWVTKSMPLLQMRLRARYQFLLLTSIHALSLMCISIILPACPD
jgi:hypothetical protein